MRGWQRTAGQRRPRAARGGRRVDGTQGRMTGSTVVPCVMGAWRRGEKERVQEVAIRTSSPRLDIGPLNLAHYLFAACSVRQQVLLANNSAAAGNMLNRRSLLRPKEAGATAPARPGSGAEKGSLTNGLLLFLGRVENSNTNTFKILVKQISLR